MTEQVNDAEMESTAQLVFTGLEGRRTTIVRYGWGGQLIATFDRLAAAPWALYTRYGRWRLLDQHDEEFDDPSRSLHLIHGFLYQQTVQRPHVYGVCTLRLPFRNGMTLEVGEDEDGEEHEDVWALRTPARRTLVCNREGRMLLEYDR